MSRWRVTAIVLIGFAPGCTRCCESGRQTGATQKADSQPTFSGAAGSQGSSASTLAAAGDPASSDPSVAAVAASNRPAQPNVVLTGTCTDEKGRPVSGVHIILYGGFATRWQDAETTTGSDGVYRFDPMTHGSMILEEPSQRWDLFVGMRIEHATMASADGLSWWDVTVPTIPGNVMHKDFRLVPGGTISGVLRERGSDRPLELDMRLYTGSDHAMQYYRYAKTDENGRFRETALFPGHYTVDLNSVNPWYPVVGEFDVRAGGETVVDWRVDPSAVTPSEDKTR